MTLLSSVAVIISLLVIQTTTSYTNTSNTEKERIIEQTAENLKTWYKTNAASIDAAEPVVPYTEYPDMWGMTVLASQRFNCGNSVYAHRYAVVLPGVNGIETEMDILTGNITYGKYDIVKVIDGCEIESDLVNKSTRKASMVVNTLESYFKGLKSQEQLGAAKNYFTNSTCGGWGSIACANDGRNNADLLTPTLGINSNDSKDAWGSIMHFDNLSANVSAYQQPFSCRVGFTTPWGNTLWITATGS